MMMRICFRTRHKLWRLFLQLTSNRAKSNRNNKHPALKLSKNSSVRIRRNHNQAPHHRVLPPLHHALPCWHPIRNSELPHRRRVPKPIVNSRPPPQPQQVHPSRRPQRPSTRVRRRARARVRHRVRLRLSVSNEKLRLCRRNRALLCRLQRTLGRSAS